MSVYKIFVMVLIYVCMWIITACSEAAQIISATGEAVSVPAPGMQETEQSKSHAPLEGKHKPPDLGIVWFFLQTPGFFTFEILKEKNFAKLELSSDESLCLFHCSLWWPYQILIKIHEGKENIFVSDDRIHQGSRHFDWLQ